MATAFARKLIPLESNSVSTEQFDLNVTSKQVYSSFNSMEVSDTTFDGVGLLNLTIQGSSRSFVVTNKCAYFIYFVGPSVQIVLAPGSSYTLSWLVGMNPYRIARFLAGGASQSSTHNLLKEGCVDGYEVLHNCRRAKGDIKPTYEHDVQCFRQLQSVRRYIDKTLHNRKRNKEWSILLLNRGCSEFVCSLFGFDRCNRVRGSVTSESLGRVAA